jgi:hypothetical protein
MNWGGGSGGNQLFYRYQITDENNRPTDQWSSSWNSLGAPLYGDPVVVLNGDGRLEVFMLGVDYKLYHNWQTTPGSVDQWSGWDPIGPIFAGWSPRKRPAVGLNQDNILELFMMDNEGALSHTWQTSTNSGKWPSNWTKFGEEWWPPGNNPAIGRNQDGRLELFIRTNPGGFDISNQDTKHNYQTTKNSTGTWDWSGWKDFGLKKD